MDSQSDSGDSFVVVTCIPKMPSAIEQQQKPLHPVWALEAVELGPAPFAGWGHQTF